MVKQTVIGKDASSLAPLVSPTFTGVPAAPTALPGTDTTQLATTEFVQIEKDSPAATVLATTTASKGGVFNGGFELAPAFVAGTTDIDNWIDGTAGGSGTVDQYGWYLHTTGATLTASFDTTISASGKYSMKFVATSGGAGYISNFNPNVTLVGYAKHAIPLKGAVGGATKYRISCKIKTDSAYGDGAFFVLYETNSVGTVVATKTSPKITGTNDFTIITLDFTTQATTTFGLLVLNLTTGGAQTIWFDDITLEEVVEDTANTSAVPTPLLSSITGVTSTDNIDQSAFGVSSWANLGNSSNPLACATLFVPTKTKLTGVALWISHAADASCVGNVTVSIRPDNGGSPSTTVIASYTYLAAAWKLLTPSPTQATPSVIVPLPCILTPTSTYWVVAQNSSGESVGVEYQLLCGTIATNGKYSPDGTTWGAVTYGVCIQTYYAKPTENATIVCNGEKISLSTNEDGLLSGAIIDLDKGKYLYKKDVAIGGNPLLFQQSDVFSATSGANAADNPIGVSQWGYSNGIMVSAGGGARSFIMKVNTLLPIKSVVATVVAFNGAYADDVRYIQVSTDGVNFTTIGSDTRGAANSTTANYTEIPKGLSTFYLKFISAVTYATAWVAIKIEADLDTSSLPQPLVHPLATNQFTEEVILPSNADRIYLQTTKYSNDRGVVVPHLEFCAVAVPIKAVPIKIDNTGETNPAVKIILSGSNACTVGTGSDEGGNFILNTGEYVTLTTAASVVKVTYQVGGGTTSFAPITKNRIYLSSNGVANSATKDPSHQMSVTTWYRVQSLVRGLQDLVGKVSNIATKAMNFVYSLNFSSLSFDPVDATTYYFGNQSRAASSLAGYSPIYIRRSGKIIMAEVTTTGYTAAGTNESISMYIRLNNTTDILIQTVATAATTRVFSNTALNIDVVPGDYIELKMICPTWVTNPAGVALGGYVLIQ